MQARNRSALFAAAALLFIAFELIAASHARALLGDYRAFYCGGSALLHGQDPYGAAFLYACERGAQPIGLFAAWHGVAVPAPLPGYALLVFVPFALLPYAVSCALWFAVIGAACAVACAALAQLTSRPLEAGIAVLAPAFALAVLPYGELASIAIAALVVMALALRRGAWNAAAIAALPAMILPHVGLAAVIAAFIFKAPMRSRLILVAVALVALDAAAGGIGIAREYFSAVLPAHALAEVGSTTQYGLTWALHGLGAPDRAALLGGEISYVFMLAAGVAVSASAARRFRDDAYLALLPPAFVVFGGSFIHYSEIAASLPAGLLLIGKLRGTARACVLAAVLLLAFPWSAPLSQPALLFAYGIAGGALLWVLTDRRFDRALRGALACVALAAGIVAAAAFLGPALPRAGTAPRISSPLAQASWSEYVRTQRASTGAIWWLVKTPTWLGLALLTLCGAYAVAQKDLVAPVAVEQMPAGS